MPARLALLLNQTIFLWLPMETASVRGSGSIVFTTAHAPPPLFPLDFNSGVRRGRRRGASSISEGLLAWYSRLLMTACSSESCHLNRQLKWKYFGFRHEGNSPVSSCQIHLKATVLKRTGKLPVAIINILSKQKPKCKRNTKLFKKKYFSFSLGRE